MTACSRRNFVSGMGALILMTGTSVTSLAKEEKADKPKRYAMVHDETACIGCTACMDACRETNHVWKFSVVNLMANSQIKNTSFSVNLANIVQTPLVWLFVQPVHHLLILKQVSLM